MFYAISKLMNLGEQNYTSASTLHYTYVPANYSVRLEIQSTDIRDRVDVPYSRQKYMRWTKPCIPSSVTTWGGRIHPNLASVCLPNRAPSRLHKLLHQSVSKSCGTDIRFLGGPLTTLTLSNCSPTTPTLASCSQTTLIPTQLHIPT